MEMKVVPSLVSLVLYLCSENAEIRESGGGDRLPAYPEPKKTKKDCVCFRRIVRRIGRSDIAWAPP